MEIIEFEDRQAGIKARIDYRTSTIGNEKLLNKYNINYPPNACENAVHIAINSVYRANFEVLDQIKDNAKEVFGKFKEANIDVKMLTGDSTAKALQIADQIGID